MGTRCQTDEHVQSYQNCTQSINDGWEILQNLGDTPEYSAVVCLIIIAKAALAIIPAGGRRRDTIFNRPLSANAADMAKIIYDPAMPSLACASSLKRSLEDCARSESCPTDFKTIAESLGMYEVMWCTPMFTTFFWSPHYLFSKDSSPTLADWWSMFTSSLLIVDPDADCYDFSFTVNAAVDRVTEHSFHILEIGALPDVMRIKYRHREGVYPKNFELLFQTVEADTTAGRPDHIIMRTSPTLSPAYFECFAAVKLRSPPDRFDSVRLLPVFGVRPSAPSPNAPWALQSPTFTDGSWYMLYFVMVQKCHHEVPAGTPRLMNRRPEPTGTQTS